MFVKENIYLSNKARSTIRRTFTIEKKFPYKTGGGRGEPPGPTSKSALVNNMCNVALPRSFTYVLSCFLSFLKNLYKSLLTSVFYVDLVCSWSILRDCSCHYIRLLYNQIFYCNKLSLQLDCNLLQLHFLLQFDFFFYI